MANSLEKSGEWARFELSVNGVRFFFFLSHLSCNSFSDANEALKGSKQLAGIQKSPLGLGIGRAKNGKLQLGSNSRP